MDDLAQQAIREAVSGNWKAAERLNRTLLENNPDDLDTIVRLANALCQLGKKKEAESFYSRAIELDKFNIFALKGLAKLKKMKKMNHGNSNPHKLETMFLEEPGKTKNVQLVHIANPQVLAHLDAGEKVLLVPRRHRISVMTGNGLYIGRLPDDLSMRLLNLMHGGNKYEVIVKATDLTQVKVFIKETAKSAKFARTPSFPHETQQFND